jgi:DDE superfamily endonuclease
MTVTRLAAPDVLDRWLAPFAPCFTRSGWRNALVLVAGAILAPGRRTVASALRAVGLGETAGFTNFHRVLNRNPWRGRWLACRLLDALVRAFVPDGPVVVGIDATLERRWGPRIRARGIYRDPVRASHQHFVKASGLRWQSLMLLVPVPWAKRVWALPFLTVLAPSERYAREHGRRHKSLADWARQGLLQVARWLPGREIVAVGDNGYAAIELLAAARRHVCMVTRLRLDARLFDPAPARRPGTMGRPRVVGRRQPNLAARLDDPATGWRRLRVSGWYRGEDQELDVHSGTAVWYHTGLPPVPIRYVLVRDPRGELRPQAFLCTDLDADPLDVLRWFVRRWATEVTFAEVRRHLGVETQRQWSDEAIARTTPSLLGLFSLVALWAHELHAAGRLRPRRASWYVKESATFSDALAAVRRCLWTTATFPTCADPPELAEVPRGLLNALTAAACYPA